jgi:hypothetical protein
MKKVIFTILFGITALIFLQSFGTTGLGKIDGTEPGFTGSPGDSLKNCTKCHGGSAYSVAGWITANIPSSGYIPGNTYTITVKNTSLGHNRFGFLVSPQKLNGDLLGTLIISDTVKTKLVGNSKYVTYRAASVSSQDFMSWTFNWIAPTVGTGDVVFYGAFNSNQDGHKGGDVTQLSTLRVKENGTASIINLQHNKVTVSSYPNPASNLLNVNFTLNQKENIAIKMINLEGKIVYQTAEENTVGIVNRQIETSQLANGVYFIQTQVGESIATNKVVVFN